MTDAAPPPAWPAAEPDGWLRRSIRVLRALAWLRWRVLVNTLNLSTRRDMLERFSRTLESLGPILIALVTIPALIAMAVLGGLAGAALREPPGTVLANFWVIARFILIALLLAAAWLPVISPSGRHLGSIRRLLLLPIPRGMLYLTETVAALADPWTALLVPLVLGVAVGAAWSSGPATALIAAVAGIALLVFVMGVVSFFSTVLHLVARNRRRAELVTVIAMLILPMIGLIPVLTADDRPSRRRSSPPASQRTDAPRAPRAWPGWTQAVPSEMYAAAVSEAAAGRPAGAALPLGALAVAAAGLHGLAWLLFRRLYDSPSTTSSSSSSGAGDVRMTVLPGLSAAASAVAIAQVRFVTRSPRGRTCLVGPLLMLVIFGALTLTRANEGDGFGRLIRSGGLGLGMVIGFFGLLALHPVLVNQFAIDGAGLTLQFLLPISNRDLLRGKAAGGAIVTLGPIALAIAIAAVVFGGGTWGQWIALALGILATYAAIAPLAAAMSIMFPRAVDFNSMGRGSNANQIGSISTALATVVAAAIPTGLTVLAAFIGQPDLAALLVGVWTVVAVVAGWQLMRVADGVLEKRRENLALVAGGR